MHPHHWHIGLIGYGEVGRILAEDLRAKGLRVSAHDRRHDTDAAMRAHACAQGVTLMPSAADVAQHVDLLISAVTASQAVMVAAACAPTLRAGAFFLDLNSASPGAKQRAAELVDGRGGCYVEGAVMTSVPPYRVRVPLLIGGSHARRLLPLLAELGFAPGFSSDRVGVASATKMCRSVMIKGLEAMVIESLTAARYYGVEDAVLASLQETFPGVAWEQQASYFFQRVIEHGRRRSEEVLEVGETVREAGLTPWSASGTAARQAWIADLADTGVFGARGADDFARSADWRIEADRLLEHLARHAPSSDAVVSNTGTPP